MEKRIILSAFLIVVFILTACGGQATVEPTVAPPSPTAPPDLPKVLSAVLDRTDVRKYESVELTLGIDAKYSNPFDAREVALDGVFTGPDGKTMKVPGFWDGAGAWKMRFTPSQEGTWKYSISVKDARGQSLPNEGEFTVSPSDLHGWVIPGNTYDPSYSPHYLVYHDGTPFYGVGHCDAFSLLSAGFSADTGVRLFDDMKAANENYVVWWPIYSNSFINEYNNYSMGPMNIIDLVVKDAQKKGVVLVFTIWDHPELRDETHAWGRGNWSANGFSKLSDINSFFTADEPWAWQENLYRYTIARWGYSPAIGMWLTASEINGTNAYDQTDPWHKKVNDYFVANDPYRHPTTASGSGEFDWPTGHVVMDMPQVHLYDFDNGAQGDGNVNDTVGAAQHVAEWTQLMLKNADKPNWIGEFGVTGNTYYPELFHNSNWAALSAGAAMTPAEWNSGGSWAEMTPEMYADISRLSQFVGDVPLAKWDPSALPITSSDEQVRAWGFAGNGGGLIWVQDFSLEGKPIDEVRTNMPLRSNVELTLSGLPVGSYTIQPYNTWTGEYLDTVAVECSNTECAIAVPEFKADIALKIIRKE
ncbi:MAG: DUF5060 domain-containing protein [Anaerolineales bacterium]|nr:DUF5060 domain-containing protein [Anaerolineales bacterium]